MFPFGRPIGRPTGHPVDGDDDRWISEFPDARLMPGSFNVISYTPDELDGRHELTSLRMAFILAARDGASLPGPCSPDRLVLAAHTPRQTSHSPMNAPTSNSACGVVGM